MATSSFVIICRALLYYKTTEFLRRLCGQIKSLETKMKYNNTIFFIKGKPSDNRAIRHTGRHNLRSSKTSTSISTRVWVQRCSRSSHLPASRISQYTMDKVRWPPQCQHGGFRGPLICQQVESHNTPCNWYARLNYKKKKRVMVFRLT